MKFCTGVVIFLFLCIAGNAQSPDYSDLFYWAAHPLKKDMADSVPSFLKDEKKDTLADVFFIHPTTFIKALLGDWNADLHNNKLNTQTDLRPILYQASIFNGSCRVYAPRYRQANLKAFFMMRSPKSHDAFDTAYADVKAAFEYYLQHYNKGRPIIIASHSQGSLHAVRLLKEFFDGKYLQKQLVCAYVVGWQIKKDDFTAIPFCNSPEQTGCVAGWRSFRKGTDDRRVRDENGNSLCVNPITWTTSAAEAPKEMHKGLVGKNFNKLYSQTISASVSPQSHVLWVDVPGSLDDSKGFVNNFHIADYNLFYLDVRENVKLRIAEYLKHHPVVASVKL